MAKVLMIWELGGGFGHMTSMHPIAKSLKAEGHQVWISLKDFSKSHRVFKDEQFHFVACPAFSSSVKNGFPKAPTFAHILHNIGFGDYEILNSLVNVWRSTFDLLKPDLIITDHSPVAMLAARSCQITNVSLGTGFYCPAPCHPYPDWRPKQNNSRSQLLADENFVLKNANKLLKRNGAESLGVLSDLYRQVDSLLITYPELDPFSNRKNPKYLGIMANNGGIAPKWPETDQPRAFAYLRPCRGIESLLETLATRKLSTIVMMPGASRKLQAKFPSLIWEENFLDMSMTASKTDFGIGNGTHIMTSQWLLAGKPLLMLPPFLEQSVTARQVVNYGAGIAGTFKAPDQISKAVDELLFRPERFRSAAEKFQRQHSDKSPEKALSSAMSRISKILDDAL